MKTWFTKILALLGMVSSAVAQGREVKEGQAWEYSTRQGEEKSFLVIRKIETLPKIGEVIHVSVYGVRIKNPAAPEGVTTEAGHLPISGQTLRNSLIREIPNTATPKTDWEEGYRMWREAYDSGKGGVFTIPVSECVGFMEQAIRGK